MAKTINPRHDTRMRESGPGVQSMNAVNPVSFLVHMKFEKRSVEVRDSGESYPSFRVREIYGTCPSLIRRENYNM